MYAGMRGGSGRVGALEVGAFEIGARAGIQLPACAPPSLRHPRGRVRACVAADNRAARLTMATRKRRAHTRVRARPSTHAHSSPLQTHRACSSVGYLNCSELHTDTVHHARRTAPRHAGASFNARLSPSARNASRCTRHAAPRQGARAPRGCAGGEHAAREPAGAEGNGSARRARQGRGRGKRGGARARRGAARRQHDTWPPAVLVLLGQRLRHPCAAAREGRGPRGSVCPPRLSLSTALRLLSGVTGSGSCTHPKVL